MRFTFIVVYEAKLILKRLSLRAEIRGEEIKPGVILDYDSNNNVVGIEILGLSKRVPLEIHKLDRNVLDGFTVKDASKDPIHFPPARLHGFIIIWIALLL